MRLDDDALIQSLHEGMFQSPLWHDFLDRLRARTEAAFCTLVVRGASEGGALVELHSARPVAPELREVLASRRQRDPLPYADMREGRVYALDDLADASNPDHAAFIAATMKPLGLTSVRCIRVGGADGLDAWLACSGGREVGAAVGALLSAVAPHFKIALKTYAALERERFRSAVTSEAFNRLKMGWFTLDSQCRIIDATDNVEQMFQWGHLLRRGRYNRLVPASPAVDRRLTEIVKRFATDGEARPEALTLSRDPWVDMLVTPAAHAGPRAAAIVYLSGDRRSQADRCDQLVDLFGLLPSEARLAWRLAQATSISDAAEDLGISVETARNYSKKIYAKTGAKGHADLVRIVLTSVLAIS